jgi:predicted nucleotidyltransferase
MIQQSDNTLATIGEVAHSAVPDARVLLFGSHARGQAGPESDYDILIITDRPLDTKSKFALRTHVRKLLLERGIRSDILVQSAEEIERKKELPGHIIRRALQDGVPL